MTSCFLNPKHRSTWLQPARLAIASSAAVIALGIHACAASGRNERSVASVQSRMAGAPIMAIVSLRHQQITVYDANGWILRALHVFGVAALALALVGSGGSVHARRGPSEPLSAAAIDQVTCSEATPRRMTRAATFKAEVLLDRLDISPGINDGKPGENVGKAIAAFQRSRGLAASG